MMKLISESGVYCMNMISYVLFRQFNEGEEGDCVFFLHFFSGVSCDTGGTSSKVPTCSTVVNN